MNNIIYLLFALAFYGNPHFCQPAEISQSPIKTYIINPAQSELIVLVHKAGIASSFGHNHVIKAEKFKGTINFSEELLSGSSVNIEVYSGSLRADLPEMRSKFKLSGELSTEDRKKIESDMMGKDQLDTAKYNSIKFHSESLIKNDSDNYLIFGNLTIHGITKRISADVSIEVKNSELSAYSSFRINQSDFNIKPFSAALGLIRNKDEIQIIFNFRANITNNVN